LSRVFRVQQTGVRPVWIPALRSEREEQYSSFDSQMDPATVIKQAEAEASEIRERAKQQASRIMEEVRTRIESNRERAKQEGFEQGYKEGFEKGLKDTEELLQQAQKTLLDAKEAFNKFLTDSEPKLLALVLEIAKKIVGEALTEDPETVLKMLRQGLKALGDEKEFTVMVKPELVAILEGAKDELINSYNVRSLEIVGDESVKNGVIIDTPHGSVDVTLESQINNIALALREARETVKEFSAK